MSESGFQIFEGRVDGGADLQCWYLTEAETSVLVFMDWLQEVTVVHSLKLPLVCFLSSLEIAKISIISLTLG